MGDNKPSFRAGRGPAQEKHKHRVGLLWDSAPAVSAYNIFRKGTGGSNLDTSCRVCLSAVYQPQLYEPQVDKIKLFVTKGRGLGAKCPQAPIYGSACPMRSNKND